MKRIRYWNIWSYFEAIYLILRYGVEGAERQANIRWQKAVKEAEEALISLSEKIERTKQ